MSDLVKRLRDYSRNMGGDPKEYLAWQAADRIEALEAALRAILDARNDPYLTARAALAPEQDK